MGKIIIQNNIFDKEDQCVHEHTGPFIDFLLREFPIGFSTPTIVLYNLKKFPTEEFDRKIEEHDVVIIAIYPAGTEIAWGTILLKALVAAVVATALNYAINALYGPKAAAPTAPAHVKNPAAGSVYNLSTPTNIARIGQPVPVPYGRNVIIPDLAAQAYSYFEDNQQYVVMMLCLGQGEYDIERINIANTQESDLPEGVFTHFVFGPSDHNQSFGVINAVANTFGESQIHENVFTSPEVSDQELYAANVGQLTVPIQMWNGCFIDCEEESITGNFWFGDPWGSDEAPPPDIGTGEYAEALREGRPIYMKINSGVNAGDWAIGYIVHSGNPGKRAISWRYRRGYINGRFTGEECDYATSLWLGSDTSTATLTYTEPCSQEEGGPVGYYVASPVGTATDYMQYDIVFPQGCYKVNDGGGFDSFQVDIAFTALPIDDCGNVIGDPTVYYYSETFASNTPQRRTIHHSVPYSRYKVMAQRTSPTSDKAQDQSKVYWTGLKSILGNTGGGSVYGETTIVVCKIKATEGLSSSSHDRINIKCTRKLNGVATRSPIDAFYDIFTNTRYGGRRPEAELDMTALADNRSFMSNCLFDGVFDQSVTIWEGLKFSLQMARATPIARGSIVTIARDQPYCIPSMAFNEDNILNLKRVYMFDEAGDYDGIEGEYIDKNDGSKQYVVYPWNAPNPEKMILWGCTSYVVATAFVERFWKQKTLRRRLITFETELDGHAIEIGTPINVTHYLLGGTPILHVVSSVKPSQDYKTTIEAYQYEPGVFQ